MIVDVQEWILEVNRVKWKHYKMTKTEAQIKVRRLLQEANEEMVRQNQGSSISRNYGHSDRLRREANQIREKYDV